MNKETKEIDIPVELFEELAQKVIDDDNYDSVEDLVIFLIKNMIEQEKKKSEKNKVSG
jgi:hypothetical protein